MRINCLSQRGTIKLVSGPNFLEPEFDISIAPRLLKFTSETSAGSYIRIYRPQRTVAFSSRDRSEKNFLAMKVEAEKHGFASVMRSPAGRAIAYHEDSVVIDFLSSEKEPRKNVEERFAMVNQIFLEALAIHGIDATVGEIPGEFCPGKFTIGFEGAKLFGTAQRVMRGGWLLGGSVIVRNVEPVRDVLTDVYEAMNHTFEPSTVKSLSDFNPLITPESLIETLGEILRRRFEVVDCELEIPESAQSMSNAG